MLKQNVYLIVGLNAIGLLLSPSVLAKPAPAITLKSIATVTTINAKTWCQGRNSGSQGKPFGISKARFYQDKADPQAQRVLIGCITNNSGKAIPDINASYSIISPPSKADHFCGGVRHIGIADLKPNQTAFFRLDVGCDEFDTQGIEITLGNTRSSEPYPFIDRP